ncbi:MAG: C39 family peptidase [Patescibacteria group bacterium]|nr:C39 family peptidase [Patescibacteria group bacterium]
MKKILLILIILPLFVLGAFSFLFLREDPPLEEKFVQNVREGTKLVQESDVQKVQEEEQSATGSSGISVRSPGEKVLLDSPKHVYQSFNNCGPATLSMILSWYGVDASQAEIGDKMRPYQNPEGDNDDKTIFTHEFVDWAEEYGLGAVNRVNGDIEMLKKLTANGFPVVVKTWLYANDDIGHFRLVRGYNDSAQKIIQDDSYQGPDRRISYYDFLLLWQPFNYNYIVVYQKEDEELLREILGEEFREGAAWENALRRAQKEAKLSPENVYPQFNLSTSSFHLGKYEQAVQAFEEVQEDLPRRMLWYQIEPIKAYTELGDYEKVFDITDEILENGNRAFSELYQLRGEIYLEQGEEAKTREQFELAVKYNENWSKPKEYLRQLN